MSRVIAIRQGQPRAVILAGLRGQAGAQGEPGEQGTPFQVDATGLLANRGAFDAEPEGFAYLATDTGDLYFRQGAAGNWSDPVPFQGPAGDSAYQVAVANGFVGTEAEWLASLDGADGLSITGAAINGSGHLLLTLSNSTVLDAGYVVGPPGTNGTNGADGRGIASMAINGSNHLIITYTDATTEDAGLIPGAGGSAVWGGIGGTLADQTDLQAALNAKAQVGSAAPQPLGTATPGVSTSASRQDHVHAMPAAADVGADPAGAAAAAQAAAVQRSNHTGTQLAATISDLAAAVRDVALTGLSLADSAVVAATDTVRQAIGKLAARLALAFDRANHTGSQAISTVTGLQTALDGKEAVLTAGTNITIDRTNPAAPVISAAGGGGGSGDIVSALVNSEVSVTGAVTLDATAFGKMHACSGTTVNYTVTLPAASGNAGKVIGFRMASGLTKLVTLDGNASETIDGATVRQMWANEVAILLCSGTSWTKIAGKTIPMACGMYPTAAVNVALFPTFTAVPMDATIFDTSGMMADAVNDRINILRPAVYRLSANCYYQGASGQSVELQCIVNKNGVISAVGSYTEWRTVASGEPVRVIFFDDANLVAGDYVHLSARLKTTIRALYTNDATFTFLKISEVPSW
ncbi:hypothetical protein ACIGFL_09280 [Pseudomonas sp. NPDC077649]|uniref:hypothetical protein n=1 Tax=Pseudomonas sp. NPDC077649 TaxID=3364423 RepID=UPI0037C533CE